MDRVFSIDERAKDDIITPWMHTYSGFDNEWIDKSDAQNDSQQSIIRFSSGKIISRANNAIDKYISYV